MGKAGLIFVLVVTVNVLAGCASRPEIPFDRSAAGEVKTIGLVTPKLPERPAVVLASSVGRSFGLIGALVDANMQSNREDQFKAMIDAQNFSPQDCFMKALTETLQAEGYTVVTVESQRDGNDWLTEYPNTASPAPDAYLDVIAGYGYVAAGIGSSTPYRPWVGVRARLVRASDSALLMQDFVVYNPINRTNGHVITIAPDPGVAFVNFDTLMAAPPATIKGLETAEEQTAQTLAKLLQ